MAKVIGICNLHNEPPLGEVTENHPLGTVSFLGRYGLMDFTLSNFSNSGINIMPILVEKEVGLIRSHIRDGNIWINNTKVGFLRLLLNEKALSNPKLNTDVNNMAANAGPEELRREVQWQLLVFQTLQVALLQFGVDT